MKKLKQGELVKRAVKNAIKRKEAKDLAEKLYWINKMDEVKQGKYDLYKEIK